MLARGLVVVLCFSVATASAAPVPKSLKKLNKVDTARFKVSYQNTPFDKVLEHFARETGLEWVGDRPDLGKTRFKCLREYNAGEYLDLLNELLEREQYALIRHGGTFYLHPSDQPVDPEKVDAVTVEDISPRKVITEHRGYDWTGNGGDRHFKIEQELPPKRGKNEVVTLVLDQSKCARWEDVRPQVKKTLSSFGQAGLNERGDEIRVTDRVDNLRVVARLLTKPERVK